MYFIPTTRCNLNTSHIHTPLSFFQYFISQEFFFFLTAKSQEKGIISFVDSHNWTPGRTRKEKKKNQTYLFTILFQSDNFFQLQEKFFFLFVKLQLLRFQLSLQFFSGFGQTISFSLKYKKKKKQRIWKHVFKSTKVK